MTVALALVVLSVASVGSYLFGTLAYSLRDYSKAELGRWFERRGRVGMLDAVVQTGHELLLTAAVLRAASNLLIVLSVYAAVSQSAPTWPEWVHYVSTFVSSLLLVGAIGVALPLATAEHAAEPFIGTFVRLLHLKRLALLPLLRLHRPVDRLVRRVTGQGPADSPHAVEEEIEQEILEIVDEGQLEGVIGDSERLMIERAIRFQDISAAHAMTARPDIVALPVDASPDDVLRLIESSGHSRIPVYEDSLDRVVGILYARDLFRYVGKRLNGHTDAATNTTQFDLRSVLRRTFLVPESKPLADLLRDFQHRKVHIAIVLDEYGNTAGLVTIEDVLEQLVGEIADEHEEEADPMLRRTGPDSADVDARLPISVANRELGLTLPEEDDFGTLGGFVTTTLGQIPPAGAVLEHPMPRGHLRMTVLEAEPQRVNRLRVEVVRLARNGTPAEAATDRPPTGSDGSSSPPADVRPTSVPA